MTYEPIQPGTHGTLEDVTKPCSQSEWLVTFLLASEGNRQPNPEATSSQVSRIIEMGTAGSCGHH